MSLVCVLQGTTGPDPCTVYVDMKSLRHDRYEYMDLHRLSLGNCMDRKLNLTYIMRQSMKIFNLNNTH